MAKPIRIITAIACVAIGCGEPAMESTVLPQPTPMSTPAGTNSGEPFLSPASDGVWLSWLEAVDSTYELRVARLRGDTWTEPSTIARSSSFFVNWADFPSIVELPDGRLAAHWLARSGPGRYAYDVVIATSTDGGETWSEAVRPHSDGTQTEHGFATLFPLQDGGLGAVWLDGRETANASHDNGADHAGAMTLRYGALSADGTLSNDVLIDGRTCDCCQTDVAVTGDGPIVVYRDRSDAEVRDISISRLIDGEWSEPAPVHEDGWVIPGCPVNGPSAAARGRDVAVAWFTAAQDTPRVRIAFSEDAGATFSPPHRIDDGDPVPAGRAGGSVGAIDDGRGLERRKGQRVPAHDGGRGPADLRVDRAGRGAAGEDGGGGASDSWLATEVLTACERRCAARCGVTSSVT